MPPRARHGGPVQVDDARPLRRWEAKQERGQVVAERAHSRTIPVDQSRLRTFRGSPHEHIDRPEIAVQQCRRASRLVEDVRAPGRVGQQRVQPLEQTLRESCVLRRGLDPAVPKRFQRRDGVSDVRREVRHPEVAAVATHIGQNGVPGGG